MKKHLALLLTLCLMLSLFGSIGFTVAATQYETVQLNGFTTWTQAELDKSSGNNGYANGCITKLTVVTDSAYIVGAGKQAIKAVKGGTQSYNNCIVNWTYGTGGPCTAGNVWAPANGSAVNYADYTGIRVAVLNGNVQPANFTKITFRVTNAANYSSKMWYWEGTPVRDSDGYFYFDFASFKINGSAPGTDIYDYMKNYASGISMLCYGGTDENTCYYSAVELYRTAGAVNKAALREAVTKLEGYNVPNYADEIAAAKAVINSDTATQDEVDAQTAIIEACIEAYLMASATGYTYAQLDGIQNWTADEASSMNGFGATYSISDQGLVGSAKQSVKLTATGANTRFCFATQKSGGAFSTLNPYKLTNAADGKLSDYEGIAIALNDENGERIEFTKVVARLMRNSTDWGSYWTYEASYTDLDAIYANGYYHIRFADYPALAGAIDDLAIISILFYTNVAAGDTVYLSDMKAYKYEEPVIIEHEYLQLSGVQGWTEAHLAMTSANNGHANSVTATYSLSDKWLVGAAAQSIKAVKSSATAEFNCLVNKAYNSNDIAAPSPWIPLDGVSKVSDYDGVMIAVRDKDGNIPTCSKIRLRVLNNPAVNGWGTHQESSVYTITEDGYLMFRFSDYPNPSAVLANIDNAQGISFLLSDSGVTEYYFSDFKAFRVKTSIDYTALEQAITTLKNNADGAYAAEIAAAEALLNDREATQADVDAMAASLRTLIRGLLLEPVDFDEDNIVLSFGAVSDIHINGTVGGYNCNKYDNALQLLQKYAGGKLDGITIAGDLSASAYDSSIGAAFSQITDKYMGDNANVFFITGNHDAQDSQWSTLNQFYSDLGKYTENDLPSTDLARGNRHMVINGYHYIGVNMMDYWGASEAAFDNQDLEWLATELAAARADKPGQPIFVYVHAGVYGTTYGSDLYTGKYWGSKAIYSYLENYPEVVTFSGHVHFPLADERTIYQKDFTSLNCGSVQYMAIESGYLQTGSSTTMDASHDVSSGLLVQVDKNNNLKITRIDFANDSIIKEPFYISAVDYENESHLLHYNDDYFHLDNTAPTFDETDAVSGKMAGENMVITFNAASDDDMVHHYIMEIKGLNSGSVKTAKAYSDFYLYPQPEDFPDDYTFVVPYTLAAGDSGFEISVYAVDSMGLKSEPIVYKSKPSDIPDDVEVPVTDNLFTNGDFELGNASGWTAYSGSKVKVDAAKNGAFGMHATGTGGWGTMIAQTVNVEAGKNYVLSFWYKTNTVGANIQVKQNDNNGAPIEGTGGWYSSTEWTYVEYKFVAPTDKVFFNVCGGGNGSAESLYFDDITLLELGVKQPALVTGGETSRTEDSTKGLGLAFRFTIAANGLAAANGNEVVLTDATVTLGGTAYRLVDFGAVMSNDAAVGTDADAFTLENLSDRTIRIPVRYLLELDEESATFAVRIIKIPPENATTTIYARPYYVYEDADGNRVVVYDDIVFDTYAQ